MTLSLSIMDKPLENIKGCIFDLDGVLVDTAVFHFLSWGRLAKELGFELSEEADEELKGVSRVRALEIVLSKGGIEVSEERKLELAALKNSWYVEYVKDMQPGDILPGVRELLEYLVGLNIPIAVASASKNAPTILAQTDLEKYFITIVDGNRTQKAKPNPEVFLTAAQDLGLNPEDCVVFEDAIAGIEGALAANMMAIGIGNPQILNSAHQVYPSIAAFDPQIFSFSQISNT